jgi:hypothetical protein
MRPVPHAGSENSMSADCTAVRFEGVVGYVSTTTNIVKVSMDISATSTGIAKRVTVLAAAALRLSLFSDAASL